jgi:hypothetical protein
MTTSDVVFSDCPPFFCPKRYRSEMTQGRPCQDCSEPMRHAGEITTSVSPSWTEFRSKIGAVATATVAKSHAPIIEPTALRDVEHIDQPPPSGWLISMSLQLVGGPQSDSTWL